MSADPRRDAALRHFLTWKADAERDVWSGVKPRKIPVPPRDAEYTLTDVLQFVRLPNGKPVVDEIGQPLLDLDTAWSEITEKIVDDAIDEANFRYEQGEAARRAKMDAPTRKRDLRDLTDEQSTELTAAVREGRYPYWIDDDRVPQEVRNAAWRILPDEARGAYLEDHDSGDPSEPSGAAAGGE